MAQLLNVAFASKMCTKFVPPKFVPSILVSDDSNLASCVKIETASAIDGSGQLRCVDRAQGENPNHAEGVLRYEPWDASSLLSK